jgi:hypothetical protein
MRIETHQSGTKKVAEVIAEEILINNVEEALQLMADLYYQEFDGIMIHEKNLSPQFFDLKTGIAGEILQKFSNYRMQLFIIGDFDKYPGKSIRDFIYESNKGKQVNFVASVALAKEKLG